MATLVKPQRGLDNVKLYVPGKPIEEVQREYGLQDVIKLASNENPIGPSPKALAAVQAALTRLNFYPDGQSYYLRQALAQKLGVSMEQVVVGNGADGIIMQTCMAYLDEEDEVIVSRSSFPIYDTFTLVMRARLIKTPLEEYGLNLDAMANAITDKTKLIFVCNPNNPTGTMVTAEEVREFMGLLPPDVLVVFDEAYAEYATSKDYPETLPYLREGRNVAILRTFSKIYGLAGLRIGYGVLPASLADMANRVRQPFNTNSLAQLAALAALGDEEHVARSRRVNEEGKSFLYREFDALGIDYLPTEANFIYFKAPGGDGKGIFDALLRKGIIIRHMQGPNLRVTIGTPEENRRFIEAFRGVMTLQTARKP